VVEEKREEKREKREEIIKVRTCVCILHGYLSTEHCFTKHSEKVGIWSSESAESLNKK
jgi:hypothetical protein